jgi:hypothetical protein
MAWQNLTRDYGIVLDQFLDLTFFNANDMNMKALF